jgi:hypothetical protein
MVILVRQVKSPPPEISRGLGFFSPWGAFLIWTRSTPDEGKILVRPIGGFNYLIDFSASAF